MKIIQAAVLVLVGALGAMLLLKVKSGPETTVPATQVAPQQSAVSPAPAVDDAKTVDPPAPVAKKRVVRTVAAARPQSQPVATPAVSQPVPEPQAALAPAPTPNPPAPPAAAAEP